MKIYFAGSIRAGRDDVGLYSQIIEFLKKHGEVLTEHIGDKNVSIEGEKGISDNAIHDRDINWLLSADILVAEVTTPSLGVGYEIGRALEHGKKILCLYRPAKVHKLSGMLSGCKDITLKDYDDIKEVEEIIEEFLK
ncbi:MAG: nucleoside 2-deoxyribosyltransferase [Nanoarchaeota archaeon]|nr:nucleoside 2-deoxyribosyltransferase [Nanoarchaeota archaeon]